MHGVTKLDIFEQVALVSFKKIPSSPALLAELFRRFGDAGINLDMISQTSPISNHVSISFSCYETDMIQVLAICKSIGEQHPDVRPLVSSGNCKLYLFGHDMRHTPGVFARAMDCLARAGVEPQLVTTSEVDISLLVTAAGLDDAAAALRGEFQVD